MQSFTNNILYDIVFEFCRYISKIFECLKEVGFELNAFQIVSFDDEQFNRGADKMNLTCRVQPRLDLR